MQISCNSETIKKKMAVPWKKKHAEDHCWSSKKAKSCNDKYSQTWVQKVGVHFGGISCVITAQVGVWRGMGGKWGGPGEGVILSNTIHAGASAIRTQGHCTLLEPEQGTPPDAQNTGPTLDSTILQNINSSQYKLHTWDEKKRK